MCFCDSKTNDMTLFLGISIEKKISLVSERKDSFIFGGNVHSVVLYEITDSLFFKNFVQQSDFKAFDLFDSLPFDKLLCKYNEFDLGGFFLRKTNGAHVQFIIISSDFKNLLYISVWL
jgi:hypothetical protein